MGVMAMAARVMGRGWLDRWSEEALSLANERLQAVEHQTKLTEQAAAQREASLYPNITNTTCL